MIDPANLSSQLIEALTLWNGSLDKSIPPNAQPLNMLRDQIATMSKEDQDSLFDYACELGNSMIGDPYKTGFVALWRWVAHEAHGSPTF